MSEAFSRATVHEYLTSGNDPLSIDDLIKLHRSLTTKEKPCSERRASSLLTAAEVSIDLAIRTDDKDMWVKEADTLLDRAISKCHDKRDEGDYVHYRKNAQNLISAYTRKAELSNWSRALGNENVSDSYDQLLEAGRLISRIINNRGNNVKGKAVELIPVLLGARSQSIGSTEKWYGRTALLLEDTGQRDVKSVNSNWDIGINLANDAQSFIDPKIRIQITTSPNRKKRTIYSAAGIPIITAKQYDFVDSNAVVAGCLQEIGLTTPGLLDDESYSTDRLDDITGRLYAKFIDLDSQTFEAV